ncbi:hypothetical protein K8M07_03565 [Schnuerera sp. xch1]|uniref:hypothetical protein n=1 Tax=Schnuerera sp. xch1 TaxID=2874283 RepID=UPI001CBEC97F|nr:hypothetical protein [Schnuerera sp. xch1]MBZ2174321.1 hypothetical protein [Schnuerera sp. xch1]
MTKLFDYEALNAIFYDVFGYEWILYQIHKVVSHEKRMHKALEREEKITCNTRLKGECNEENI